MSNMPSSFKGKVALVVDDEPDLREILKDELEIVGFDVVEAENGIEAFEITHKRNIDIIISDIRMPNGSGLDLLDKLNRDNSRVPVLLFMSGYSDLTPDEAYHKGAAGILSKPFDSELLINQLERLVDPIPRRWVRKAERIDVSLVVEIEIPGINEGIEAQVINIGTGGMFIAIQNRVPTLGSLVAFKIHLKISSQDSIEGCGMVRWVRPKDQESLRRGFGIEFQGLDEKNAKKIFDIIELVQPKPFIPKQ